MLEMLLGQCWASYCCNRVLSQGGASMRHHADIAVTGDFYTYVARGSASRAIITYRLTMREAGAIRRGS